MKKKSQAAMEFLMTYGWALLVVLIAIAALAFFGLLNPSRFLPEKCTVPPGFGCSGYIARAGAATLPLGPQTNAANLSFFLMNGAGETLYNVNINLPECAGATKANPSVENGVVRGSVTIPDGSTVVAGLNCTVANSLVTGDRFRGAINITYQTRFENTLTNRTKSGDIIIAVQ